MRATLALVVGLFVLASACASPTSEPTVPTELPAPSTTMPVGGDIAIEPDPDFPSGTTGVATRAGDGWRLLAFERRGHPYRAAIATSERGIDRLWELLRLESNQPPLDLGSEVLITLAPAVSGSCPDIVFRGVTVGPDALFGSYDFPVQEGMGCTADANPVTFIFAVDRDVLPDRFTLSVYEELFCGGCPEERLEVDMTDEAALEAAQFGGSRLAVQVGGDPPEIGQAAVVQWTLGEDNGLLFTADEWLESPFWFQSFEDTHPTELRGFLTECDECIEECVGDECAGLARVGPECSLPFEPEPFVDVTATVVFEGTSCTIELEEGYVN